MSKGGGAGIAGTMARMERRIVGGFMRVIAAFAERRVRRSLDGKTKKRARRGVHVDLKDRLR